MQWIIVLFLVVLFARTSLCQVRWRLVGGKLPNEGTVEVYYNGTWGSICVGEYWYKKEANIACRSLGLPPASFAFMPGKFLSSNDSQISWLTSLRCNGNESSLAECSHAGWGNTPSWCKRYQNHASVVCGYPQVVKHNLTSLYGEVKSPGYPNYTLQAHYEWTLTFSPPVRQAQLVMVFHINLKRYSVWFGNLTVKNADGKRLVFVQNQRLFTTLFSSLSSKTLQLQVSFFSPYTVKLQPTRGFRMLYLVINKIENASVASNWNVTAESKSPYSIRASWSPFTAQGYRVVGYLMSCNTTEHQYIKLNVSYAVASDISTSASCAQLIGHTSYQVQVFVSLVQDSDSSQMMAYRSKTVNVKTKGAPDRSPTNLNIALVESHKAVIQWDPILPHHTNGAILGYRVLCNPDVYPPLAGYKIITNETRVILKDLKPAMHYRVQVSGFNIHGSGPPKLAYFDAGCGGNIIGQLEGTISFSNKGRRWFIDCRWTFKPQSKSALILIILDRFSFEDSFRGHKQCNTRHWYSNVLSFTNDHNNRKSMVCHRTLWFSFVSYGSAKVRHQAGFNPKHISRVASWKLRYYIFNQNIDKTLVDDTWNIIVLNSNSTSFKVSWAKYQVINGKYSINITKYFVLCTPLNDTRKYATSWTADGNSTSIEINQNVTENTEYIIQVLVLAVFNNLPQEISRNKTLRASQAIVARASMSVRPSRSSQRFRNSVNVSVGGLNISEWDQFIDFKFKNAIASVVTEYCSHHSHERCTASIVSRKRRSNSVHVTFTAQDVHLLPGYPVQFSDSSIPDHMIAVVAFYVKFPPGVAIGVTDTVDGDLLVDIVKGSLARIGRAINKTILSVSTYLKRDHFTAAVPSVPPPYNKYAVIGGSVAAVVISIVIALVIRLIFYRKQRKIQASYYIEQVNEPASDIQQRSKKPLKIENPVYDPATRIQQQNA